MSKTIALVGKIGPAFGDGRASHGELEFQTFEDESHWVRISNFERGARAQVLESLMFNVVETVMRDGDFGGVEYVAQRPRWADSRYKWDGHNWVLDVMSGKRAGVPCYCDSAYHPNGH